MQDGGSMCEDSMASGPFVGQSSRKAERPRITTARRRELLKLAIDIVELMQTKTEKHERRYLFNAIENQFEDS